MSEFSPSLKGTVQYLEASPLSKCDFLVHAFLTRRGGVSGGGFSGLNFSCREGDEPGNVARNWSILADSFGLADHQFVLMHQVHGNLIRVIGDAEREITHGWPFPLYEEHSCDALVTDRPGIAIGVKTADCVPIFLVDRVKRVIGVVHAGWRGTVLNILGSVVEAFVEHYSSRRADILAAIGPAIGQCCYQVDGIVYGALKIYEGTGLIRPCPEQGRWMLDLAKLNKAQLEGRGIPVENITLLPYCTSCLPSVFYSHRRDHGLTGRHFNFMMLKA